MQNWRVEFCGFPISDFRKQRQSSVLCENQPDALAIYAVVKGITTWDAWVAAGDKIRAVMLNGTGGYVWRSGVPGVNREVYQRDSA